MLQQLLLAAALNGLALETVEMGSQPDAAAQSKPHELPRAHLAGAGRRREGVQLTYAVPCWTAGTPAPMHSHVPTPTPHCRVWRQP